MRDLKIIKKKLQDEITLNLTTLSMCIDDELLYNKLSGYVDGLDFCLSLVNNIINNKKENEIEGQTNIFDFIEED